MEGLEPEDCRWSAENKFDYIAQSSWAVNNKTTLYIEPTNAQLIDNFL
jgi:hypothetical protein